MTGWASKKQTGFTIVELLIVIVVIGILAAITIVAFNGIQQRAANTKTTSAAAAWIKGIRLYYNDKGEYPSVNRACLGTGYPMGFSGTGSTQCRTSGTDVENATLNAELAPYMGNSVPSPDMTPIGTSSDWFRGILYYPETTPATGKLLAVTLRGISVCPQISGSTLYSTVTYGSDLSCRYKISE